MSHNRPRGYAEKRFRCHLEQFEALTAIYQSFAASLSANLAGSLDLLQTNRLAEIKERDGIFADLDPALWISGARPIPGEAADA